MPTTYTTTFRIIFGHYTHVLFIWTNEKNYKYKNLKAFHILSATDIIHNGLK